MAIENPETGWCPTASRQALQQRAEILARLRQYFADAEVLEVETPLLASGAVTDSNIQSFVTSPAGPGEHKRYLSTSPEFAMKRLLASGSGPVYQVCKAFRRGELGRLHNPEFSLLEWYRPGFDHHRLMEDVASLVIGLGEGYRVFESTEHVTYGGCFQTWLGLDPHQADVVSLQESARQQGVGEVPGLAADDKDGWLDLLMSHCIQPHLGKDRLTFVYDYPASQAALARLLPGPPAVAARFELFIDGVEIANGFHELRDAAEQRARFEADLVQREQLGYDSVVIDEYLLAALATGLPDCAGVALGLDRLLLVLTGVGSLTDILAFPYDRM